MRKLSMEQLNRKSAEEYEQAKKFPVVAVLENVRSAYNVGSVFRTADAFLLESIIITGYTAHPPQKEIRKTALGAERSVPWKYFETTLMAINHLRSLDYQVYAVEQVAESISLENLKGLKVERVAFIFGNEVSGVDADILSVCDGCIEIPQFGTKHSINISVAAGIVLWEAVKNQPVFTASSTSTGINL